jgi:ectoine hydroxylase-related dioxygenase (phytanoyl-CoA dioxygenase family)
MIAVKLPSRGTIKTTVGRGPTDYHQDIGPNPTFGPGVNTWIALHDITPETGSVRFREGSHRLGVLSPPLSEWPQINKYQLSAPLFLSAGDATCHYTPSTVHGAHANTTNVPRWALVSLYIPAHSIYNGMRDNDTDPLYAANEITIGKELDHPLFPILYDPQNP